ncbi:Haloacid dehalogenase domain protein hydrolase [Candidatus Promineifilum breve]|uniref:Haloacid dehalogenase domain protein hydrolase n=1 Tax=Candidatus Promineifilum breve TaxID=1806508 RepID=A0A160TAG1_9CHLR|nr:HAD family hydrolase [Candidatus Promineifilum breve]CUS06355.1 Haloacid dehalogenase domain protein hydrolase [Candidatus Promineifilum breve]
MIELIAFDADDTLWHTERLYLTARQQFRDLIGGRVSPAELDALVHDTEMRNLPYYGFGITSFILSLIETAIDVTGGGISGAEIGRLLVIAREMISADVELMDEVEETLAALAEDYPLLLITKGDLLHQTDKVARSGLGRYFSAVEVVADKTPQTYGDILARRHVAPERFVMIGNSPRSDVLPVATLGGRAIHVPDANTWVYDMVDLPDDLPGPIFRVSRLSEVVPLIRGL